MRAGWGRDPLRLGRLPLVLLVGACLVAVTAAISGAATPVPGLRFAPGGHWVASPTLGLVFHINGAARSVDARADVGGVEPGSQVVQGDTSGYVVGSSRIVEFGKSSLSVERTLTPSTDERPVAVEAAGGPYLVYRKAGRVVRLGDPVVTITAGGMLGEPVTTRDGTLWLHRADGALCQLAAGAERISCPATAPAGHTGALTVVDERPVFVDTTADTLSVVAGDGLGTPTRIGKDVPPDARVAPADVAGRVAILEPTARRMLLVDAGGLGAGREPAESVTVRLPDGAYSAPSASGSSVVLLDARRNVVLTYSSDGVPQRTIPVPPEAGEPSLSRGQDERVYVDGAEGRHVLVVDHDGAVGVVPVIGDRPPDASPTPVTPSTQPPVPPRNPDRGPPVQAGGRDDGPPAPRPTTERPAVPASPPGMPPNLRAVAQGTNARVTWNAAAANGAAVSAYQISWARTSGGGGGSASRSGGTRSITLTGLTRGVAYRITVVAQNSAGRGAPARTQVTLPQPARTVTVSRGPTETYNDDCEAPECGLMHIEMRGFKPNTEYSIRAHSDDPEYSNGVTLTTEADGSMSFNRFHFGQVGVHVWVTVDGVESNHFRWVSG